MKHKQYLLAFTFLAFSSLAGCASTEGARTKSEAANPYFYVSPVHSFPGIEEATSQDVQNALDDILSERRDLDRIEDPTFLSVHLTPEEEGTYRVSLSLTTSGSGVSSKSRSRSFVVKPGQNLAPELKRQLGILMPPPKRAKAQVNDLTQEEVQQGYDRLHKRLHKRK